MTDEEKKAIEGLKVEIDSLKVSIAGFERDIEDKSWCNKVTGELKHDILIRETILNLLKKQDNRIKELESDKKIKDKMIELMLEELTDCEFEMKCSECCCECEKNYDQLYECNKQYFENLAKESVNNE